MSTNPLYLVKDSSTSLTKVRQTGTKFDTAIVLFEIGMKVYKWLRGQYFDRFTYHVNVSEKQAVYSEVNKWLLEVLPNDKHKSLTVYSGHSSNGHDTVSPDDGSVPKVDPLVLRFSDRETRRVYIEGHKVEVQLRSPDVSDARFYERMEIHDEIIFTAFSHEAQKAIVRHLEKLNQQRVTTRKGVLKMTNSWGDWTTRSDLPPRTMDSVNLPAEQKERLITDLEDFLKAEDHYNSLAIPYHRGYMFYGPPGTGKTSLAKALANHFNLDMWYISLSDLKTETSLMGLLSRVGPRSLLLLEDIDTIQISHDRDSGDPGQITMSSLLNALDGVSTPHGLITIMTTNRFDILDPALTRAGRMDVIEELSWPTTETVEAMFHHFYKESMNLKVSETVFIDKKISTSTLAEIMKRHLHDSKSARKDILSLTKEKTDV